MKDTITLKLEPWIKIYLEDKAKRESKTTDELIEGILQDYAIDALARDREYRDEEYAFRQIAKFPE